MSSEQIAVMKVERHNATGPGRKLRHPMRSRLSGEAKDLGPIAVLGAQPHRRALRNSGARLLNPVEIR